MRLQEMIFLVLMIGFTCSMQAQSQTTYPSQKGRHTLSIYPLHRSFEYNRYARKDFVILPAIGYNYHFKKDWSVQGKLFYRQMEDPFFDLVQIGLVEKNIKVGLQYYCVNKRFQIALGLHTYLEKRNFVETHRFDIIGEGPQLFYFKEKEVGVEFSLSFSVRITDQARLVFGTALRHGEIKKDKLIRTSYRSWQDNILESFGFGYTF